MTECERPPARLRCSPVHLEHRPSADVGRVEPPHAVLGTVVEERQQASAGSRLAASSSWVSARLIWATNDNGASSNRGHCVVAGRSGRPPMRDVPCGSSRSSASSGTSRTLRRASATNASRWRLSPAQSNSSRYACSGSVAFVACGASRCGPSSDEAHQIALASSRNATGSRRLWGWSAAIS
jgi:hypothetical protein